MAIIETHVADNNDNDADCLDILHMSRLFGLNTAKVMSLSLFTLSVVIKIMSKNAGTADDVSHDRRNMTS